MKELIEHMEFHGYVWDGRQFYKPYTSHSLTVEEAIAWLRDLRTAQTITI